MTKSRINWEQVRTQLRASERALEEALAENPARVQAVLRKRAAQLALNRRAAPSTPRISALIFTLQAERFAIRLQELAEVLPFRQCTPVPGAPAQYLGVIHRHGELRMVVDLACIVNGRAEAQTDGFVLMLRQEKRPIGLRVDRVEGLHELSAELADEPAESAWQGSYSTKVAGEALLLLNLPRVLGALP
jgi:purine-binding chemotaxis protein CheW